MFITPRQPKCSRVSRISAGQSDIHAAIVRLALLANHCIAALRAMRGKRESLRATRVFGVFNYLRDLRNHVAASLYLDPIANQQPHALDPSRRCAASPG